MQGKNGYTPWTVTKAVYAMDKRGNCTEIVFLANNLNEDDSAEIRKHLTNLHFQVLQSDKYDATFIINSVQRAPSLFCVQALFPISGYDG